MKAVLCEAFGPAETLVIGELPSPECGPDQVRLGVHACGVNYPDTLIIQGKYQFKPEFPFSPGAEAAGVILETGSQVTQFAVGDRVCRFGLHGGFTDELICDPGELVNIPESMSFQHAAAFLMVYGTSFYALKQRANLQAGESVLVLGAAGGVGLAAVELAKAMGASVIAAASSDDKLAVASERGADHTINYLRDDLKDAVRTITDGRGVDVVYDPVGGELLNPALRNMATNGRYLIVGFASGEIPSIPGNLPLLKECQVVGVFFGAFTRREPAANADNIEHMMRWYEQGKIRPHLHATYPLEDVAKALHDIGERRVIGKVVLTTDRLS